jgi:uncharacterized ion transporter superfamily protein YfcC
MHVSAHPLIAGVVLTTVLMIFGFAAGGWYAKDVAARFPQATAAAG